MKLPPFDFDICELCRRNDRKVLVAETGLRYLPDPKIYSLRLAVCRECAVTQWGEKQVRIFNESK